MRALRITGPAQRDIDQIVDWWAANRDADQARRWQTGLKNALHSLQGHPEAKPLAPESAYASGEVRQLSYGVRRRATHRVLYVILNNAVVVLRVRHLAQDTLGPGELGLDS